MDTKRFTTARLDMNFSTMAGPLSSQFHTESCWIWGRNNESKSPFQDASFSGDDADLAKEMNALTVEEREKVYDDIHGVTQVIEETPEFIEMRIRQMDEFRATSQYKRMKRAFFLCPKLETDKEFKLMFLRADDYNPRKANERMGKYFDYKCSLFGEEKLVEDITIHDLNEDEINSMRAGVGMELPWRDRTGRPIIFLDLGKIDLDRMKTKNPIRLGVVLAMGTLIHDEMSQRKGIIFLFYHPQCSPTPHLTTSSSDENTASPLTTERSFGKISEKVNQLARLLVQAGEATTSLPMRIRGVHVCYDDPQMDLLVRSMRLGASKDTRFRLRSHLGSEMENEYKLNAFGIPTHNLLQNAKMGDTTLHSQYVERKQQAIASEHRALHNNDGLISHPDSRDVLIGRGVSFSVHAGSQLLNDIMLSYMDVYKQANRFEKTCITMNIVKTIQEEHGGRFLQRTKDGWKVLDGDVAREKIAIAFRARKAMN